MAMKLPAEADKKRKELSLQIIRLHSELSQKFDEEKAEKLYKLEGDYTKLVNDPGNFVEEEKQ